MGFWKDLFAGWDVEPNVRPPPAPTAEAKPPAKEVRPETFHAIDDELAERLRKVAFVPPVVITMPAAPPGLVKVETVVSVVKPKASGPKRTTKPWGKKVTKPMAKKVTK